MSDLDEFDFAIKKKTKKRKTASSSIDFDENEVGSSILSSTALPTDSTTSFTPANTSSATDQSIEDNVDNLSTYVKKQRSHHSNNDLDENLLKLVQISTKSVASIENKSLSGSSSQKPHDDYVLNKKPANSAQARASGALKVQTSMDYAADICKDFRLYGYCSWGDTCKFIHDRSERKSGNQLDDEWDSYQQKLLDKEALKVLTIPEEHAVPKQCQLCGASPLKNPIITPCKHFFCLQCATQRFSTGEKTCYTCDKETNGRFANALQEIQRREKKSQELTLQHNQLVQEIESRDYNDQPALLKGRY